MVGSELGREGEGAERKRLGGERDIQHGARGSRPGLIPRARSEAMLDEQEE